MKYLKLFKEHIELNDIERKEMIRDLNQNYSYDDSDENIGKEQLEYLLDMLKDIEKQDTITLYRVVWVKNKEDIDTNNLGKHYVKNLDSFHEGMMDDLYQNMDLNVRGYDELDIADDAYLITVEVDTKDIDYKGTLIKNVKFPYEEEILLKDDNNVRVIDIKNFYN